MIDYQDSLANNPKGNTVYLTQKGTNTISQATTMFTEISALDMVDLT